MADESGSEMGRHRQKIRDWFDTCPGLATWTLAFAPTIWGWVKKLFGAITGRAKAKREKEAADAGAAGA